jgi:aerobic carbon-monoxide dehydrogenase large subunit
MTKLGVGARLERKEDDRFLRGRGQYVADIKLAGMRDVAFLRSPVAHATIGEIEIPTSKRGQVFIAADLVGVKPILAVSGLPGFKASAQPVLATGKVRHVGELVAMCVANTRAEAEDLAESVRVDYQELPVVFDMLQGRRPDAPLVHEEWHDNLFLRSELAVGDMESVARGAPVTVRKEIRTARQCISPMEGRGVVAHWDYRLEQLVVISSCQVPHLVRTGLSECLGLDEGRIRVVAPDVGGGFGYKCILLPEEVCLGWLARRLGRPVRWIEDRREQLTAGANCREHHYLVTAHATKDGRILGLDVEATVDSGAYSVYPFTACLEAGQLPSMLPGPYDFPVYRGVSYAVASNKVPITPYRGVSRPGTCLALELIVDAVARAVNREPSAVRLDNLVRPEAMPFDNIAGKHFDGGDYPDCLRRAVSAIGLDAIRERQRRGEKDGRLAGVGFAFFNEQGAVGTTVYSKWGIPMVPGHEQASVRLTPDGVLELKVGIQSHGQGLETTLAQVVHEVLGIDPARVRVIHGDTALTPYSIGTWGSRSMVMAGGAVAHACRELAKRIARIGAYCLKVEPDQVTVDAGEVVAGGKRISIDDVARIWYRRPQDLPLDVDSGGLELTVGYKPRRDSGTFSYSAHAVVVVVDTETGHVEIEKYVVVEDGGTLINPMIVEGQVYGGVAQGIGSALYEEMPFDEQGQPLASTLSDYILPGAGEIPAVEIIHTTSPSPNTEFGVKGIGEGGTIGPPAAILNGINDALRPLGAEVTDCPVSPRRLLAAIAAARGANDGGGAR